MLSGQRPFDRGTPIATALSHVNEPSPPLPDDVPQDLRDLILECLEKDPERRPANAAAVAIRLGLGDQEVRGLALGLATAINGSPADLMEAVEELAEESRAAHAGETGNDELGSTQWMASGLPD
jgi:serine/threonine-protein kinase